MSAENELLQRSGRKCELCGSTQELAVYEVPPNSDGSAEQCVMVCGTCREQLADPDQVDPNHWRCLNDSMWSQLPAVQVVAWRILEQLRPEGWPLDLLDSLYLEEDTQRWAEALKTDEDSGTGPTLDSNGIALTAGDSVTLIKDLVVKGAGFTAKRGTVVKNISLTSNPKHVEGKVNGTLIVLVAGFLKKAN